MKFAAAALILTATNAQYWDPCECLGYEALPTDYFEEEGYGAYYGSSCANWDSEEAYCMEGGASADEEWCDPDYTWCYVDPECEDSMETVYFDGTPYDDLLNWRECSWDDWEEWDDWEGDWQGANNLVAAFATAFAVASIAM